MLTIIELDGKQYENTIEFSDQCSSSYPNMFRQYLKNNNSWRDMIGLTSVT